jgi:flagellar motor switch protein FliN/FliY
MSDGSLSQDEIDALLQGGEGGGDPGAQAGFGGGGGGADIDALKQILDGIVGAQSSNLSGLMGDKSVTIGQPEVAESSAESIPMEVQEQVVQVSIDFSDAVEGRHSYILSLEDATRLAGLIVGQEQVEMGDMALEALKESLSTITGVALNTFGDEIGGTIMPTPAGASQTGSAELTLPEGTFAKAVYSIVVEGEDPIELIELFDNSIVSALTGGEKVQPQMNQAAPQNANPQGGGGMEDLFGGGGAPQQQPQQQGFAGMSGGQGGMMMSGQNPPNVQSVQFPSFNQPGGAPPESGNISLLMDVYMEMTVELGRTKKTIKEILGMGEGTIIELDKLAGEPVDILVNHKLIATGEVVVIDENFGVRVTEIVSPAERMKDLT